MDNKIKPERLLKLLSKHIPDMVWIKDLNNCYLYANKATLENFLFAQPDEVVGKDDSFFIKREQSSNPNNKNWYDFEGLCLDSDSEVIKNQKPITLIESGHIRGEKKYIEIYKAPFYDEDCNLIGTFGVGRDITQKVLLAEENKKLVYFDQLTKLPNRHKIVLDIQEKSPKSCLLFSIDSFKTINDVLGIEKADQVLIEIAKKFTRLKYNAYRIGGDEFAILFYEDKSLKELEEIAEQIVHSFDEKPFIIDEKAVLIFFSIGIAKSSKNLLAKAVIAANQAKSSNNYIKIYQKEANIEQKYKEGIEFVKTVRDAILSDRVVCYYQPLLDIKTGKIYSYEALARILDKDGNIITPDKFLWISKKIKLYSKITQKVIYEACKIFQNRDENFSVNISVDDIKNKKTVDFLIKTIKDTDTASRITFEILESEKIESSEEVNEFMYKVKALGAKIAIDDFGTGYSNFEHILRLDPIDYIKIDGSLIKNIALGSRYRLIVETIVEFARKLGIKTVAEFVSDENILDITKNTGIDYAQGYHIGKPKPF